MGKKTNDVGCKDPSTSITVTLDHEGDRIVVTTIQSVDYVWNEGQSALMIEWNNEDENIYNAIV